ncbi:hypothetical protein M1349_05670, partial [Patescibacteria group bacterium]|nr:hypothetical protein [Patescibacteria group bacterium]
FPTISKPTVAFGKLQPQSFPENAVNENFTYSIDTLTGNLPNLSDQTRIYKMQPFVPDLLTVNKFQEKVMHTGFQSGYTAISDRIFEWKSYPDRVGVEKRIRVNIVNGNFTITSPYMSDSDILKGRNLPSIPKAIDYATNMLNNMQMMPDDIDLSKTKTNLFSIQNGSLVTSTSLSNSQIIEVNYYQKDINKLPVFYEKPNSSNISILIAGGPPQSQIVGANFIHQSILDQYSTYPIKTANQAFEELKKGNAYIASYFGKNTNISINNVFLVYYIGSQAQDFLMPVIVFEGSNGFFAYVPAVTDEWINK